jgi:hypothetical protein
LCVPAPGSVIVCLFVYLQFLWSFRAVYHLG